MINIARFCFGLTMFLSYPLDFYVAREVVDGFLFRNREKSLRRHVLLSVVLSSAAMCVALLTSNLGIVLEISVSMQPSPYSSVSYQVN